MISDTNKILVYTITDFKENAVDCIDLLFKSINENNKQSFDFFVVSNVEKPSNFRYNFIDSELKHCHITYSKYSKQIPDNYDVYVYLDSDILFFGDLSELFEINKDVSVVQDLSRMNNEWFCYPYATNEEKEIFKKIFGLNAGTFSFKSTSFLSDIRQAIDGKIPNEIKTQLMLEQSAFNYVVYKNYLENQKCNFIDSFVKLYASQKSFSAEKKLYHFCGFTNEMKSKYLKMKELYDEYLKTRTNIRID